MVAISDCCLTCSALSSSILAALYTSSWEAIVLKPSSNSPNSPPTGRAMRVLKLPPAIERTPRSNSFTGRMIVRALITEPRITSTQIDTNTATVTSRVRAELTNRVSLGLMPSATTPR